ncbi:hypothetical protein [Bacillus tequilensis]|uniref:hypothetical protein n=1 Tax=Bacillus tequilensis TaxID=227866 RepID=UPI0014383A6A|nr:hypothetical protein [Bacillus tequilensis]
MGQKIGLALPGSGLKNPDFFLSFIQALSGFHRLKVMIQYTNVLQLQSIVGADIHFR